MRILNPFKRFSEIALGLVLDFVILNGSPVRKDSSIIPWPSITTPSTGQISCG